MLKHHPKRSDKFMQDTNRKSCKAYSISSADYWTHHSSLDCLVFSLQTIQGTTRKRNKLRIRRNLKSFCRSEIAHITTYPWTYLDENSDINLKLQWRYVEHWKVLTMISRIISNWITCECWWDFRSIVSVSVRKT